MENTVLQQPFELTINPADFDIREDFIQRHIGPGPGWGERASMLEELGVSSIDELIAQVVPESILSELPLPLEESYSEQQALQSLRQVASKNQVFQSLIGQGYYNTETPNVILRNILESPAC